MKTLKVIVFCIFFLVTIKVVYSRDCIIDTDIAKNELFPIILKDNYKKCDDILDAIYLPVKGQRNIEIPNGKEVYIACPKSNVTINKKPFDDVINLKCQNGHFGTYGISDITCKDLPKIKLKNSNKKFDIGFEIKKKFLNLISGKFNHTKQITLYTKHKLVNTINSFKPVSKRPPFDEEPFPGCKRSYTIDHQKQFLPNLVTGGDSNIVRNYFANNKFLARGHLTPNVDFTFPYLKRATFLFYNCVPQWQQINNGNWKALEKDVRDMAAQHSDSLDIYTGTVGVSEYFNKNTGYRKELYLCKDSKLPIPRFMWKIVVDTKKKQAIAFVMSNNPYNYDESSSFKCTNNCDKLRYHIPDAYTDCKKSFEKGCLYCCQVDNVLSQSIRDLPSHLVGYSLLMKL